MNNIHLKKLIKMSDVLLEILDSRFPNECRLKNIENEIINRNKKLILVLNKIDLVDKDFLGSIYEKFVKEHPTVYISVKTRHGSRKLRETIKKVADINKEKIYIGVFGFPNTGKSSIINILVGARKARTSPEPGFTKGIQLIKLSKKFYLIDSPGVYYPKNKYLLAILGAIKVSDLRHPEKAVMYLYKKIGDKPFEEAYNIKVNNIKELFLSLKEKFNYRGKDWIRKISEKILYDWQKGKIKGYWM